MFFKIESNSATMYNVDTLFTIKEAVTAMVIASQPEKNPSVHTLCVKESMTMAIARATNVRAMQTWVGSFLNSFMYLSEITAPTHEITTFINAKIVPTMSALVSELLPESFFFPEAMIMY